MLDIKFVRENPDAVKENIKKKFQDAKLPLVDEVIEKDAQYRAALKEVEALKAARNKLSKANGPLFGQLKKCTDEAQKAELQAQIDANNAAVKADADKMAELEKEEEALSARIQEIMYSIPQMIDPSVPIGPDDTYNVEAQRFGEPVVPDFPIPYHTEIMESFDGIDMDAAGRVAGNGFYYLLGNIARLHEAVLAYARDFMINKGFTYVIPPFMMHGNVVQGVMSFPEMDAMMYKIEGEDLYLIGTSEHTMIGRFIDQTLDESKMPLTLTSYSPCFRKEKGAHGIEERGIYRIHQFEKQEMIVVCRPEESADWYEKLWQMSVELFRSMEIPVRQLNCCSGDLADLKVKSCDIEAWSPRQQKYFEVCSCSNLGDAQARRLRIRIKGKDGKTGGVWMYNKVELCGVNTGQLPVLTEAEKRQLLTLAHAGDKAARARMVEGNLRLVLSVVQRFAQRGENLDDLFQVGCIGLIKAIDNFDPAQPVRFSTYGVPMIIGEIRRFLRDNNALRVSRTLRDTAYRAMQAREALEKQLGREPTMDEISAAAGLARREVTAALESVVEPLSLDEPVYTDGGDAMYVIDQVRDPDSEESWISGLQFRDTVAALSPREKRIMELRYLRGKTQMEVAQEIGISQAQVSRLEKGALQQFHTGG